MKQLQKTKARLVEVSCNAHHAHIMNAGIFYNSKDPPYGIRTAGRSPVFSPVGQVSVKCGQVTLEQHQSLWPGPKGGLIPVIPCPCFQGGACQQVLLKPKEHVFA